MKLDEFVVELNDLEPDERLEWLVEFADQLPDLSAGRSAAPFPESCRIQECQTPVFLWIDQSEGRIHLEADVPRKSPTVRGLVALLVVGLDGETVESVQNLPEDLISVLGLNVALGMTRQQGFRGLIRRLKRAVLTGEDHATTSS